VKLRKKPRGVLGEGNLMTSSQTKITRAISIRQPFVELILRRKKKIEFRSIPTKIRERVYLYAGRKPADSPRAWRQAGAQPGELPTGVIVGSVEIVGCRYDQQNDEYHYVLRAPRRLARPLHPKNQPQPVFWRPKF
jgi:hypothetical protein